MSGTDRRETAKRLGVEPTLDDEYVDAAIRSKKLTRFVVVASGAIVLFGGVSGVNSGVLGFILGAAGGLVVALVFAAIAAVFAKVMWPAPPGAPPRPGDVFRYRLFIDAGVEERRAAALAGFLVARSRDDLAPLELALFTTMLEEGVSPERAIAVINRNRTGVYALSPATHTDGGYGGWD